MGIWRYNSLIVMDSECNSATDACDISVGDYVMTDMGLSKIFFKDKAQTARMMLKISIKHIGSEEIYSVISVTPNHVMLVVKPETLMPEEDSATSSDEIRIPEMLKCDKIVASSLKIGDIIPRWAGNCGIVIDIQHTTGKSVQLMTENGLLMIDKNIITCYVIPYGFVKNSAKPVKLLSAISPLLVSKPLYWLPKKIYKFGMNHNPGVG